VNEAKATWENKKRFWGGTPQNYFHEMMGKFDAHSNLFIIFPSENNYGSVVAGAVKGLVKVRPGIPRSCSATLSILNTDSLQQASVNHKKTVEALSKALKRSMTRPNRAKFRSGSLEASA
jgi:hypothetical protein